MSSTLTTVGLHVDAELAHRRSALARTVRADRADQARLVARLRRLLGRAGGRDVTPVAPVRAAAQPLDLAA